MHHKKENIGTWFSFITISLISLTLVILASTSARADTQSIIGDPLEIYCYDTGQMAVKYQGVHQYYGDDPEAPGNEWGSVLMFDYGSTTQKYADPYHYREVGDAQTTIFTGEQNYKPGTWHILTKMNAGDSGVELQQETFYTGGDNYYTMYWEIRNTSNRTYRNCKFFHGGDAYFADSDEARSFWDINLGMIYLRNPGLSGLMGFYGGEDSPADRFYGGEYKIGDQQAIDGELSNTVDSDFVDAGYHLQWNLDRLRPGEVWMITAYEKWTEPNYVQVLGPGDQTGPAGYTEEMTFIVKNFEAVPDTFDLEVTSALGWPIAVNHDAIVLAGGASAEIYVSLDLPADSSGLEDTITLTATSQAEPSINNSDSAKIESYTHISDNGGGSDSGGCTIYTSPQTAPFDPIILLLVTVAMVRIIRRFKLV
jgi:hypothetical protein